MGKLLYGPQQRALEIDDRDLAHLKIVMLSKLRRGETFAFSWENPIAAGSGRGTLWMSPSIPLEFTFFGNRRPILNRAWIQQMAAAAERGDLQMLPEPEDGRAASDTSTGSRW